MSIYFKAVLWIMVGVTSHTLNAQRDSINAQQDTVPSQRATPLNRLIGKAEVQEDSTKLLFYNLDNINDLDSFEIKGLEKHFQQYDPARQRNFDYGNLGNVGSSAYPLALELSANKAFSLGYNQYKLYQKTESDIIHFDQVRPFSELYFSAGESQSDLRMNALFSRTFANDVNLVIDYDRISQIGVYSHQATRQTSLLTSLAYRGNKKLSIFLTYIINASLENQNGGVEDLTTLSNPANEIRQNVSVLSRDAENRLQNQSIIFNAFYRLGADSIKSDFINSIQYQVQSFNEFFRFTDSNTSSDSILYKSFYVSDRGIRNYNEHNRIRNGIFLNSKYKDYYHFRTGLVYDYNSVDPSGVTERFNEVYLKFKGGIQLRERFSLDVDFYYGLLDVANEFGLDASAQLKLFKNNGFNFAFNASRYGVNYIEETVFLNQDVFYDETFSPIILQSLKAEYFSNTKMLNLKLGGQVQNTLNFLYFDKDLLPTQDSDLYSVSLIYGIADLKIKSLLLENSAYLQSHNKELLNLPSVFTKNSISYYGKVFKDKMLLKAGLDFRYIISDHLPYYNPVIGQFYLNEDEEYEPYPMLDARISFKVSSFTTFLKYENLTSFLRDDVEQLVQDYPQFDARFRFGILWNLWN